MPIHDRSYRHWEGEFKRGPAPWWPMLRYHLKVVLKQKLLWTLLLGSFIPALVLSFLIYLGWRDSAGGSSFLLGSFGIEPTGTSSEQLERLARYGVTFILVVCQSFFVLSITSVVGSRLIARDLRANALELYLTKPITRDHYLLGKLAVIAYFIFLVTFAPTMLVWIVAAGLLEGFAVATIFLIPRIFLICAVVAIVNGSVILALSSLAKSSRYATVIWFALCFLSLGTAQILVQVTETSVFSLVSYRDTFAQFATWIMDVDPNEELGLYEGVSPVATLSVMAIYLTASVFVLRRTLRGVING